MTVATCKNVIEERLTAFDEAITRHEFLEIDGDIAPGEEGNGLNESILKIINHNTKVAHSVSVSAIVEQRLPSIIKALETGVTTRLYGVTRIVGYYSRINGWNKSKKAELIDRHKGSYKLGECEGLEIE